MSGNVICRAFAMGDLESMIEGLLRDFAQREVTVHPAARLPTYLKSFAASGLSGPSQDVVRRALVECSEFQFIAAALQHQKSQSHGC